MTAATTDDVIGGRKMFFKEGSTLGSFFVSFCLFVQKISVARIVQTRIVGVEGKGTTRILSKNPKRLISRSFSC